MESVSTCEFGVHFGVNPAWIPGTVAYSLAETKSQRNSPSSQEKPDHRQTDFAWKTAYME